MGKKMAVQGHTVGGQEGGGRLVGTYENNWLGMVRWTEGRWTNDAYVYHTNPYIVEPIRVERKRGGAKILKA